MRGVYVKAIILNTTLKNDNELSHTEALASEAIHIFELEGIKVVILRINDYNVAYGISDNMGEGDEWPKILEKILDSDIVIIGTPLWLGEKSSIATLVIERLYGSSKLENSKGQSIFYNKVGGVIVTGNEDGAKHASASIIYGLSHIGFTIPPNVDAYWVGEVGPGPSYMDINHENEFTTKHIKWLVYNTIYMATILKEHLCLIKVIN